MKILKKITFAAFFSVMNLLLFAQEKMPDKALVFGYFKNNGEDGLHMAYSKDALKWIALKNDSSFLLPSVGNDKLMRDPCIVVGGDGKFHMVWTVSWKERGIGYASSEDLIHWSTQQYLPLMEGEKDAMNSWAPEINYDPVSKRYLIYWATTIPGKFPQSEVKGEKNHRIYLVWTKDFKQFTSPEILYDKGFNVIDASIQKSGNNYIMFLKNETKTPVAEKNIRIAFSKRIGGPYGNPSNPITGNYWAEGPTAIKKEGKWIVYFDKYNDHKYGAVTSADLKKWKDISDQLIMPEGIRHGTVFEVSATVLEKLMKQ
ncbi:glycoside hydrolase family 43 protein [Pedobacter sp. UBA5917]|jgi:beta-xylosidase|uniref:glycoside hydrolase family 43 protein n=1 Tax=Pedobacter sp. UBA5917 TaxID=1947061 RepID=UPI0025D48484|nr:glycoside hydrolase family 43 protein [Pedobacter sp. UBA5917]